MMSTGSAEEKNGEMVEEEEYVWMGYYVQWQDIQQQQKTISPERAPGREES